MNQWNNKVVVVTGGSDGLGREIALTFARLGAKVVVLARRAEPLDVVVSEAKSNGLNCTGIVADVTLDQSVQDAIVEITRRFGRIDVWVNNVGKSTRTELTQCSVEQYKELMEVNFYSVVRCSLAALPHLEKSSGHLVSIGSLASKTGWPFVAPYATSKHAVAAFHHQLKLEGPPAINYLLVCPGPIQRPDAGTRYEAQAEWLANSASQPGGGAKLRGIAPQKLAEKIERYCRLRKSELIVPWYVRILFAVAQLSPGLGDFILRRMMGKD